jgi:hypothetical protein
MFILQATDGSTTLRITALSILTRMAERITLDKTTFCRMTLSIMALKMQKNYIKAE